MLDIQSILLGMGSVVAMYVIYKLMYAGQSNLPEPHIDPSIANDIVGETPKCPDCMSYDLTLIDNIDGLPWLKGHTTEIDYYVCNKCHRQFSDEDWRDARSFDDRTGSDD